MALPFELAAVAGVVAAVRWTFLALVGDALAATHNPRVLLPVILEVIMEATGATGGQVFVGRKELAWIGEVGGSPKPLSLGVGFGTEGETTLLLFPPEGG